MIINFSGMTRSNNGTHTRRKETKLRRKSGDVGFIGVVYLPCRLRSYAFVGLWSMYGDGAKQGGAS